MKITLILLSLILSPFFSLSQEITGTWNGNLEVQPGRRILFVFQIFKVEDSLNTKITIPSQGAKDLQSTQTTFKDGVLFIDASNLGFKYNGKWKSESGKIEGVFQEGINSVSLILTREVMEEVKLNRPQEPIKPYPYRVEEVIFTNQKDNITLAGTLTLPNSTNKNYPVAILISGSGPQDRDESFSGHKPFLVLSDYLTKKGIAVLRYDDRGFAESTGDFENSTTADFATDVLSAVEFLKKRVDIDKNKIGLIGHSEGAIIAPMTANVSKDIAFIVMLAGTGIIGKEVSLIQAVSYRNFPIPDENQYEAYIKEAIKIASSKKETKLVKQELTEFYQQSKMLKSLLPSNVDKDEFIENLVATRTTPWIRFFYNYNPIDEIKKLKIPVLALYGSKDTQVPPKYHLQPVSEALAMSKSKDHEVKLLNGLNHLFQECETGQMSEYPQIEQTFSPKALEIISNWILKQTK